MSQATTEPREVLSEDDPFYPLIEGAVLRLVPLFMRPGRTEAEAFSLASRAVTCYQPQSPSEIPIIARIISSSFNALEASAQAMNPKLTDVQRFRLVGRANSLSRTAAQAERLLFQTNKAARATVHPHLRSPNRQTPDAPVKPAPQHNDTPPPDTDPADTTPTDTIPTAAAPTSAQMEAHLRQLKQQMRDQPIPPREKPASNTSTLSPDILPLAGILHGAVDASRPQPAFTK